MKKLVILSLFISAVIGRISAQQPAVVVSGKAGWHKIGETKADFKKEKDELLVLGNDKFIALQIKVTEASLNLMSFDIYFEDGTTQSVSVKKELKAPGETEVVKLNNGMRGIKKIVYVYKSVGHEKDKKARLELWGQKTEEADNGTK